MRGRRINLEQGYDLRKAATWDRLFQEAVREKPKRLWLSLPCTPWTMMQNFSQRTEAQ
jgi:hypothetical protein